MEFDLVRRMGVRIIEDPELDVDICYVEDRHLAIVRGGLDLTTRQQAADWLLAESTARSARSTL